MNNIMLKAALALVAIIMAASDFTVAWAAQPRKAWSSACGISVKVIVR